ncbi:HEAT repeat domain-containing protein [Legionella quinlivanii]|uniref:HEAT repeat domain-containing protein n=1 Tax=Legionella quinlivanii TaxID=45073 RepID=UPI002243EA5E|nr:hypothetical protein [Legionella quinlivanii]MCW8452104.1 hypothetical protein [Legionella quinlivanii]
MTIFFKQPPALKRAILVQMPAWVLFEHYRRWSCHFRSLAEQALFLKNDAEAVGYQKILMVQWALSLETFISHRGPDHLMVLGTQLEKLIERPELSPIERFCGLKLSAAIRGLSLSETIPKEEQFKTRLALKYNQVSSYYDYQYLIQLTFVTGKQYVAAIMNSLFERLCNSEESSNSRKSAARILNYWFSQLDKPEIEKTGTALAKKLELRDKVRTMVDACIDLHDQLSGGNDDLFTLKMKRETDSATLQVLAPILEGATLRDRMTVLVDRFMDNSRSIEERTQTLGTIEIWGLYMDQESLIALLPKLKEKLAETEVEQFPLAILNCLQTWKVSLNNRPAVALKMVQDLAPLLKHSSLLIRKSTVNCLRTWAALLDKKDLEDLSKTIFKHFSDYELGYECVRYFSRFISLLLPIPAEDKNAPIQPSIGQTIIDEVLRKFKAGQLNSHARNESMVFLRIWIKEKPLLLELAHLIIQQLYLASLIDYQEISRCLIVWLPQLDKAEQSEAISNLVLNLKSPNQYARKIVLDCLGTVLPTPDSNGNNPYNIKMIFDSDSSKMVRLAAANCLASWKCSVDLSHYKTRLQQGDVAVREELLQSLAFLGSNLAVEARHELLDYIIQQLDNNSYSVCLAAINCLSAWASSLDIKLELPRVCNAIAIQLNHTNKQVRMTALNFLNNSLSLTDNRINPTIKLASVESLFLKQMLELSKSIAAHKVEAHDLVLQEIKEAAAQSILS